MESTTKKSYGELPESFLDKIIEGLRTRRILPHIPEKAFVVDLGCGFRGKLLSRLSGRISRGIGYDRAVSDTPSSKNIQLVPAVLDQPLPLPAESADVVTSLAVVEHLERPEIFYEETFRILKSGGVFLFTTPSRLAKPLLELMAFKLKIISQEEIADHKRYYDKKSLAAALIKAGFSSDKISLRSFQFGLNLFGRAEK